MWNTSSLMVNSTDDTLEKFHHYMERNSNAAVRHELNCLSENDNGIYDAMNKRFGVSYRSLHRFPKCWRQISCKRYALLYCPRHTGGTKATCCSLLAIHTQWIVSAISYVAADSRHRKICRGRTSTTECWCAIRLFMHLHRQQKIIFIISTIVFRPMLIGVSV